MKWKLYQPLPFWFQGNAGGVPTLFLYVILLFSELYCSLPGAGGWILWPFQTSVVCNPAESIVFVSNTCGYRALWGTKCGLFHSLCLVNKFSRAEIHLQKYKVQLDCLLAREQKQTNKQTVDYTVCPILRLKIDMSWSDIIALLPLEYTTSWQFWDNITARNICFIAIASKLIDYLQESRGKAYVIKEVSKIHMSGKATLPRFMAAPLPRLSDGEALLEEATAQQGCQEGSLRCGPPADSWVIHCSCLGGIFADAVSIWIFPTSVSHRFPKPWK